MPFYVSLDSPEDRLFVLYETTRYIAAELDAGRASPIKTATRTGITAYATIYRPLVGTLTAALGTRAREVSEAATAKKFLEEVVRDYIDVLKRRTRRRRHNVEVLVNHGLPENGDVPPLDSWAELKIVAGKLIAGDALSATAYSPMSNPTAGELHEALTAAQEEHEDVAPADSAVQAAQSAINAQTTQADFWVSEIRFDALDTARREDDPGQRRLLRKLGFKFKSLPGDPPEDPGDTPTAVAPTPPTG
jgi:hypothetical protein